MSTMAVICEYNPFHNGHKYQLTRHKEVLGADSVICLMSGSFVQRGAPAIYDKWTRAKDAVLNGADLVIELPVVYSAQSAQRFASGAVNLLDKLGVVDFLSFGSECGDIDTLTKVAKVIASEEFNSLVEEKLKSGISYPAARTQVIKEHYPELDENLISSPNNILSIEYINAINKINSNIEPKTLLRNQSFASASEIRSKICSNESVTESIPTETRKAYDMRAYDNLVLYHFRKESPKSLQKICDMTEGLENKFKKASQATTSYEELAESVKSKRYTRTRIDRISANALLGIEDWHTELKPQYARILAFNSRGQELLAKMKKVSQIPIITKVADANPDTEEFSIMFEKDLLSTDIYSILTNKPAGLDYKTSPIKL
ncbi:MAG: nucleotidyltransferase [Clostridia bacterium]|nr:nucleotidyltransferase [Clostridia bacterium]